MRTVLMTSYQVGDRLTTGRNLLLQFLHSRHRWRSDDVSRVCIWVRQALQSTTLCADERRPSVMGGRSGIGFGVSTKGKHLIMTEAYRKISN